MKIHFLHENHTFTPVGLDVSIQAQAERIRELFDTDPYGMVGTSDKLREGDKPHLHGHGPDDPTVEQIFKWLMQLQPPKPVSVEICIGTEFINKLAAGETVDLGTVVLRPVPDSMCRPCGACYEKEAKS